MLLLAPTASVSGLAQGPVTLVEGSTEETEVTSDWPQSQESGRQDFGPHAFRRKPIRVILQAFKTSTGEDDILKWMKIP